MAPNSITAFEEADEHVMEGVVGSDDGSQFPVIRGVPCFIQGELRPDFSEFERRHGLAATADATAGSVTQHHSNEDHCKTVGTFSDKWQRYSDYGMEASHQEFLHGWYCKKLGLSNVKELQTFYRDKAQILEVGPGSGFNSRFMAENTNGMVFAADISEGAFTTFENTRDLPNCHVVQADVMDLPFADESFDFVIADGVLHHTPDTRAAVEALYRKVRPGGQFFFYIYKKMGAARQFCDHFIRQAFSQLSPAECYEACEGITELGQQLSALNVKIKLDKGIPILGVPPGEHDVQRLIYYNFAKCFWNDAFDHATNNMVNYDWYHPAYAWQHTEDEVVAWLKDLGVEEFASHPANPNGLSILLTKPRANRVAA